MNVITVVGARPQFIKAAVVSRAFVAIGIDERIVHTGQHFDANMSDVFFEELGIPSPTEHLGIGGGPHGQNTGRMIERMRSTSMRAMGRRRAPGGLPGNDERGAWGTAFGSKEARL